MRSRLNVSIPSVGRDMRLPIGAKLFAGFGIVLLLMTVMGVVSISRMASLDQAADRIYEEDLEAIVAITKIEEEALQVQELMTKGVLAALMAQEIAVTDPDHAAELELVAEGMLDGALTEADDVTLRLEELMASGLLHGELLAIAEEAQHNWGIFLEELAEVEEDEHNGLQFAAGEAVLAGEGEVAFAEMIIEIDELNEALEHEAALSAADADSTYRSARTLMLVLLGVALTIGGGVAFYLARTISSGMAMISGGLQRIAVGELDEQVSITSNDELGDMSKAYNEMQAYLAATAEVANGIAGGDLTVAVRPKSDRDVLGKAFATMLVKLREVIGSVMQTAGGLTSAKDRLANTAEQAAQATQEIAKTIGQVAEGTSQQAIGVQEINSSVTQLGEAITLIAQGAQEQAESVGRANALGNDVASQAEQMATGANAAADGVRSVAQSAESGATTVQNTIDGMERIQRTVDDASREIAMLGERSAEIGKIVGVIEDIAAQTNLLALNAAIEAARAGEQGRGFAVVADEVRKLAERVSNATKEIADLIGGVQQGVDGSIKAMDEGTTEMQAGNKAAAEAGQALQQILASVSAVTEQIEGLTGGSQELKAVGQEMAGLLADISDGVEQNSAAAEQMQATADTVTQALSGIASVAEENSAATEQVSASSEQMSAQVSEVATATDALGTLSEELLQQVSQFKIESDGGGEQARRAA